MKVLVFAFCGFAPVLAQPLYFTLNPSQTQVNFTLGDVLHKVHGTFHLTAGTLWIDPATGKAGGHLTVAATTGDSGSHARDSRMQKNILQSSLFPEIIFTPDSISGPFSPTGDSTFKLHGQFTIHGSAHELTANVKSHLESITATASADFAVPYVAWGMKDPSTLILKVSNTVEIQITTVATLNHGPGT